MWAFLVDVKSLNCFSRQLPIQLASLLCRLAIFYQEKGARTGVDVLKEPPVLVKVERHLLELCTVEMICKEDFDEMNCMNDTCLCNETVRLIWQIEGADG